MDATQTGYGSVTSLELLELARAAAEDAGALLAEVFVGTRPEISTKSTPTDLVSAADFAAERAIRKRIYSLRPDDGFLGEEEGNTPGTSGLHWVVDPLDGTVNFLFGIPEWGTSIACQDEHGRTLVGVIHDPLRSETWTATHDGPCELNGERIQASTCADLSLAMVATGFSYDENVRRHQGERVARLLPKVRDIRRLGSAALDMAWTAGGRFDAYYEIDVQPWDIAAGALLCDRAGLSLRDLPGRPGVPYGLAAAPMKLVDELVGIVG